MIDKTSGFVLFSVLNWGLGHASRSIPFIRELSNRKLNVVVCSDGQALQLIQSEIPGILSEELPAYDITYSSSSMLWNMIKQSPRLLRVYKQENREINRLVKKYKPIFIVSDNRYGCYHQSITSYFLGHQWNILGRKGTPHHFASKLNQYFIKKFDHLLIPDDHTLNLSGKLSVLKSDFPSSYTGLLTRFSMSESMAPYKYKACAILSGPEPSRSILEQKLLSKFSERKNEKFILVSGKKGISKIQDNVDVIDIANAQDLSKFISESEVLISRSGYSSIMDYVTTQPNKWITIPTRGQTEQEYLARRLYSIFSVPFIEENELHKLGNLIDVVPDVTFDMAADYTLGSFVDTILLGK